MEFRGSEKRIEREKDYVFEVGSPSHSNGGRTMIFYNTVPKFEIFEHVKL